MIITDQLDATFAALADPTRRAIIQRLAAGRRRDAQRRPCRLEAAPLAEAVDWLETYREFWEARFQRLDTLLAELRAPADNENTPKDDNK